MAIRVGGQSDLGPPFRKQRIGTNPYRGFSQPPPFDPRTGHNVPLVPEDDDVLAVSVAELVESDDYAYTYDCYVLSATGALTSTIVRVLNTSSDPLPVGAVALAWKSKTGTYWMKTSATDAAINSQTVDFIVDRFDRGNANNLGDLWNTSNAMRILDGVALNTIPSQSVMYAARLSGHNYTIQIQGDATRSNQDRPFEWLTGIAFGWGGERHYASASYDPSDGSPYSRFWGNLQNHEAWSYSGVGTASLVTNEADATGSIEGFSQIVRSTGPYGSAVGMATSGNSPTRNTTLFKAWVAGVPEPSGLESGHGTWDATNGFVYTDKYHATGVYNPLA